MMATSSTTLRHSRVSGLLSLSPDSNNVDLIKSDELDPNLALVVRQRRSDRDYQRVIQRLRGLPTFMSTPGNINNTPEAAFTVAGGPSCLIREVLLMPLQHEECPDQVFDLIESARKAQNSSQFELALDRLNQALEIWENKVTWKSIVDGMDPVEALAAERERRHAYEVARAVHVAAYEAAIANRTEKAQQALQSTTISDAATPTEAPITEEKQAKSPEGELEDADGVDEEYEDEEDDDENDDPSRPASRIHRPDEKKESPVVTAPTTPSTTTIPEPTFEFPPYAYASSPSPELPSVPLPTVSQETELEFALFIWNAIGSVYQSQADDRKALLAFWRAKLAHDGYVAKKQAEEKARADAERAAAAAAKGADDDEEEESEEDDPTEPAATTANDKNADKGAMARRKPMDPSMTSQFPHEPIIPIQPYQWCTTANAITYSNIGCSLYHLHEYDLSLRSFHVSAQIRFACLHPTDDEYVDVGTSLNNMGVCLAQMKRFDECYAYLLSAEQVMKTRLDPIHPRINAIRNNLEKIRPRRNTIDLNALTSVFRINNVPKKLEDLPKPKAKAKKKGVPSSLTSSTPLSGNGKSARRTYYGRQPEQKTPEEENKERFMNGKYFQTPAAGTPATALSLRQWQVQMSMYQRLLLEHELKAGKKKKKVGKKKTGAAKY